MGVAYGDAQLILDRYEAARGVGSTFHLNKGAGKRLVDEIKALPTLTSRIADAGDREKVALHIAGLLEQQWRPRQRTQIDPVEELPGIIAAGCDAAGVPFS